MKQYDDTNRFVLFISDTSDNPKKPSHKGTININGTEYKLAGWVKQSGRGTEFISGSVEKADAYPPSTPYGKAPSDDEISF